MPEPLRAAERLSAWMAGLRPRPRFFLALSLGLIAALGHAPVGAWPVTLVALALIYGMFSQATGWRQAAWIGWAGGIGYFALSLSWIVEPFLVDIVRHGWMAPFAIVIFSAGFALFWALPFGLARAVGGRAPAWVACFVLAEAVRGSLWTGFPWAQIGHVLIDTALLQWASIFGSLGLSALVLVGSAALWATAVARQMSGVIALVVLTLLHGTGFALNPAIDISADAPVIRLVQPNAPQHEKWDKDKVQGFFERQLAFSAAGDRPDLIVWPETAIPWLMQHADEAFQAISDAAGDVPVVLGALRLDGLQYHNSMVLLNGQGQVAAVYDKFHLVPFGEYVPFGNLLGRLGISGMAPHDGNGFTPGTGPQVIDMGRLGRALPLICYEGVFANDIRAAPERADFMLLITNDAWFGKISGPYQHLAQARLRSVEQGLPMIRAANTGVSAMIDARGRVTAQIPLGQAGWIDAALPPPHPPTLYARTGDLPVLLLMALMLGLSLLYHRKKPE